MAILLSNNLMWSFKIVILSTVVLSFATMLKLSAPTVVDFAVSEVPSIWSKVISWLRPPYLYIIINAIIISIVASSKLQNNSENSISGDVHNDVVLDANVYYARKTDEAIETVKKTVNDEDEVVVKKMDGGDEVMVQSNRWTSPLQNSRERPPVSARLSRRKSIRATNTPEGKSLRVTKPKRQDTLETTWRVITEGRSMPLTRHLKKSDTWDTHPRPTPVEDLAAMKKSETFNDRSTVSKAATDVKLPLSRASEGSGKLKREPSLGQDELNRRVEAFIKKFNEQMRLQREESLNQYHEMISRGAAAAR